MRLSTTTDCGLGLVAPVMPIHFNLVYHLSSQGEVLQRGFGVEVFTGVSWVQNVLLFFSSSTVVAGRSGGETNFFK